MRTFTIEIDEEEYGLLSDLLVARAANCERYAKRALESGYGSGISQEKAKQWQDKAADALDLNNKLAEEAN
jgi:hypothetical protein